MNKRIKRLVCPRSVAVVGASSRPGSVGGEILRNVVRCGYKGEVHPVNPNHSSVNGVDCFSSIYDLPGAVDLAVIAVNKDLALGVVESCGKAGIKNLVIVTAGFKESGEAGVRREAQLRELVHSYDLNLVGPNCMGMINTSPAVSLNASFSRWFPPSGEIAFISQSGSVGETMLEFFSEMGLGVRLFVNLGNRAGLTENDLLTYLSTDERTSVIFLYLESFAAPREFRTIVETLVKEKPLVVFKAGRTKAGAAAVASHTGSLASPDAVVEAFLDQCGAIRVSSIDETITAVKALRRGRLPQGRRTVIITNAGGAGIIAADACERENVQVPPLPDSVKEELASFLPPEAGLGNPIDMISTAGASDYERSLGATMAIVDSAIVIFCPPLVLDEPPEAVAEGLLRAIGNQEEKPVIVCTLSQSEAAHRFIARLGEEGIDTYTMPEAAVDALSVLSRAGDLRSATRSLVLDPEPDFERAMSIVEEAIKEGHSSLYFGEGAKLLSNYGIDACPYAYVTSDEEALAFAQEFGYPLVAKIDSPGLFHRFERGAVITGLANEKDLTTAIDKLRRIIDSEELHRARVMLQPTVKGRELILGLKRDESFGPVVMFGLGGTLVEALKDVSFATAPVTIEQAKKMIESIRAFPLLKSFRGQPAVPIAPLADAISRLGRLSLDLPLIEEVDLNPFIVGKTEAAVDIPIKLGD